MCALELRIIRNENHFLIFYLIAFVKFISIKAVLYIHKTIRINKGKCYTCSVHITKIDTLQRCKSQR